ncbi:MAG: Methicillin resistance protein [Candidatus Magasanikbacteria bacterium GW2011_GWC2_37_14]|uniref:Methicillin resistance protein n=1 Tax=Candidatus Magasanikbacteria bacterium GW2011_GWC2_37_14 TaxID=1619046 RepID=A0A0G0JJ78_9BACT|nr:MAG: Methicillin resistance protein [Candidatus Magasanikbacteria bacterium GW2011_GWC2_37_14]
MYKIEKITNHEIWENFNLQQLNTLFVQSVQYGKFYEKIGEQFWIFGIFENNILIGGSLVVTVHARRGNFLYLPYGPIGERGLKDFFSYLKEFAKKNNYDFIRVSPFIEDSIKNKELYKNLGFRSSPIHVLAETTWLLDLATTQEELLQQMDKTHRYLIKRCEKEGVKIEKSDDINKFNKLHDETAKRHKFIRFSNKYITNEFNSFTLKDQCLIFNGFLSTNELDSSAVIIYYGNMAAYRHGASLNLNHKISTSYLLQWEAIKEAKKRGIKYYNFWGIAPENAKKNHPFKGITHFKKGFGGYQKDLLHCQDLPISYKYCFAWIIETLRRIKRRF